MKFRPLQDWTLIRPNLASEKTSGGIYIPDAAQEKPQHGEVLAIGEGRFKEEKDKKGKVTEKKFEKTTLKPGDRVFYEKYSGTKIEIDHEELVMVREEDVLGYIQ
ncbi:MAG TPA: co-chaperone GroES [Nitrospiria bacterium]|jgi:chaperonin GroES